VDGLVEYIQVAGGILVALLGLAGIIYQYKHVKKLNDKVNDLSKGYVMNLRHFNDINKIVIKMFEYTSADRFLILTAMNGTRNFRIASALYEQHNTGEDNSIISIGAVGKYVNFEFDNHYLNLLHTVEQVGSTYLNVDEMPDCDLKNIYKSEGVTGSKILFITRKKIDDKNDRVFYCSIATHVDGGFDNNERTIIKSFTNGIKTLLTTTND